MNIEHRTSNAEGWNRFALYFDIHVIDIQLRKIFSHQKQNMTTIGLKPMRIMRAKGLIVSTVLLLAGLVVFGCATTKKITGDVMGKGRALKKNIAVLSAGNPSRHGDEYAKRTAEAELKAFLNRHCDDLLVIDTRRVRNDMKEIPRLPSGQIDNLALAALGRTHGLNAVLEQRVGNIQCATGKGGLWGFGDASTCARLSFSIRAYDIETTAILFDEFIEETVELSQEDWQRLRSTGRYDEETAHRLVAKIIPQIAGRICRHLAEQPWKGYIVSASGNTFTLAAGKGVGLAPGDILEVFAMGEPIEAQSGQVYLLSGPKIGEIKVTKVQRDQATAVGILGTGLEKSSYVKLKP
jgi:hypothetical protein